MLGAGTNGSKISIAKWQTATFPEMYSASAKSTGTSDVLYGGVDCSFNNELARKAFTRFCIYNGLELYEHYFSSAINLDAVLIDCIMSTGSTFLEASSYIEFHSVQLMEAVKLISKTLQCRKGGSIPKESAARMKTVAPSAADNLLQLSLKIHRMYIGHSQQS